VIGIALAAVELDIDPEVRARVLQSLVTLLVALVVWLVIRAAIHRGMRHLDRRYSQSEDVRDQARGQRLATLVKTALMASALAVVVVTVLILMGIWGIPVAPILAVGSVIGIAIGFGARDFVRDVIAGILVLAEDQYSVGDVVRIAGVTGTVEEIRIRTVVLRDLDASVHHIQHGAVDVTTNLTHDFSRIVVDISIAAEGSLDGALGVVEDELERFSNDEEWASIFVEPPQLLGVNELADSGIDVRVLLTTTPDDRWRVKREFLRRIKNRFDAEGIEIA
jgi:small conductance mechanosensitive channel